jgi:hypothetical protein
VVLDEARDVFLGPADDVDSGLNAQPHGGVLSLYGRQAWRAGRPQTKADELDGLGLGGTSVRVGQIPGAARRASAWGLRWISFRNLRAPLGPSR